MKDIMLKITGKQIPRDTDLFSEIPGTDKEDVVEFITPGTLSSVGDTVIISYDETEISGTSGYQTQLAIQPGKVVMKRTGDSLDETIMEFEKGKRYHGMYATPYGNISMELLTNDVRGFILEGNEHRIYIDYDISLKGLTESRNTIDIEVIEGEERNEQ